MVGRSVDSIVEQVSSEDAEGFLEEHESSKKLHWQESFDEGNVLKQRSHPDSMDSGITGSQSSLDNEDDAQPT